MLLEAMPRDDLRRTVASGRAKLGINLPVIEKVLNHTPTVLVASSEFISGTVIHADGIDVLDVRWCYRDQNDDVTETHHGMQVPLDQIEEFSRLIQAAAEQYTTLGE